MGICRSGDRLTSLVTKPVEGGAPALVLCGHRHYDPENARCKPDDGSLRIEDGLTKSSLQPLISHFQLPLDGAEKCAAGGAVAVSPW